MAWANAFTRPPNLAKGLYCVDASVRPGVCARACKRNVELPFDRFPGAHVFDVARRDRPEPVPCEVVLPLVDNAGLLGGSCS